MITIDEDQLAQVQYLFEQSSRGHHLLFDADAIRRVFRGQRGSKKTAPPQQLEASEAEKVERHIEKLLAEPSLEMKRAYLETLDSKSYEWVLRTYFSILENQLPDAPEARH